MSTYVFELSKECTVKKRGLLIIDAPDLKTAEKAVSKAYNKDFIFWDEDEELDPDISYEIQSDSCLEDDTFDSEQFSTQGMQPINIDGTPTFTPDEVDEICRITGHKSMYTLTLYDITAMSQDAFKTTTLETGYSYELLESGRVMKIPREQYRIK